VYAIVRSGSKQQKVAVGDVIEIDRLDPKVAGEGDVVSLPVVMVVDGDKVTATGLDKASVKAEVTGATKGPKIVIRSTRTRPGTRSARVTARSTPRSRSPDIKG
jgi:large subunit ribosomal protein L21